MTGKCDDLFKRVRGSNRSCNSESDHALDPSIDNGRWSSAKIQKKGSMLEGNSTIVQVLFPILRLRQTGMLEKC